MTPQSVTHAWARLVVRSLEQAGVSDVVICPGSRSTPLAWAALVGSGLKAHSLIDERCAAYFALGQAKATGRPAAVICTSGTAAANCLPAAVEATASRTPLVILTADRPPELQQCAANQTISQARLFGEHCRHFVDLGLPDGSVAALQALQRKVVQAVLESCWPVGGAVHCNAPFRKPLGPASVPPSDAVADATDALAARGPTRVHRPLAQPAPAAAQEIARTCQQARCGLVSCGPMDPWRALDPTDLLRFLRATGFLLVCDAASQVRFGLPSELGPVTCDAFDLALRSAGFRNHVSPEVVVHFGAPRVSTQWEEFLRAQPNLQHLVIAGGGWPDPSHTATVLMLGDAGSALREVTGHIPADPPAHASPAADARRAWRRRVMQANETVWRVVDSCLSQSALSEAAVVRTVVQAVPPQSVLALGNSLPIREVDLVCPAQDRQLAVCSQRGASGIDGVLSSAAGSAQALARPTTLLVGDLSFLHDLGGLWAARQLGVPFVIVIVDNNGGRIFEQLPMADVVAATPEVFDFWLTPHGLDLTKAASLFGCAWEQPEDLPGLRAAVARAHERAGPTVVRVPVPPSSAQTDLGLMSGQVESELGALAAAWRAVSPGGTAQ